MDGRAFETERRRALEMVEIVGHGIEPDGDWTTVLIAEGEQSGVFGLALSKEHWPALIRYVGREYKPRFVALVVSVWTVFPSDGKMPTGSLSVHPDRKEQVVVEMCDGNRVESWVAAVQRRPGLSPVLESWKQLGETRTLGGKWSGRLAGVTLLAFDPGLMN